MGRVSDERVLAVINYMISLKPRLGFFGCYFTHIEPWLNPEELADLWYFEGAPDTQGERDRIFHAVPDRFLFVGHYHTWLLAKPAGIVDC